MGKYKNLSAWHRALDCGNSYLTALDDPKQSHLLCGHGAFFYMGVNQTPLDSRRVPSCHPPH
jgi:hypothetical protein